ncbi:MAG: hypothetical protein J7J36_04735 [Thermoplasmata archaeon]|nr:hypothetical protein [Thermoplasmata archaeon]
MNLTNYEKKVLYGITKYPEANDRELSLKIGLKQSTVTAIRKRLKKEGYYKIVAVPMLQNFGMEILAVTHANFNPVIPLSKRIEITEKKIESFEEIIFSMGEEDKGFSISFSKNYTDIGRINDIRTKTFGSLGLLEKEYPDIVIFPFKISKIYRFFNFSFPLRKIFGEKDEIEQNNFFDKKDVSLSKNEKYLLCSIIENPEATSKEISKKLGLTRHTVGRLKRKFFNEQFVKIINVPALTKIGFELLSFYHIKFNPHSPPDFKKDEGKKLMNDDTIFMATREFESILISVHQNYEDYKISNTHIMQTLKENEWNAGNPAIRIYSLNKSVTIKNLNFYLLVKKLLSCK